MEINEQSYDGNTPLHLLCKNVLHNDVQQKIRIIEKLLKGDLEINAKNNEDCRPIFFSCTACEVDLLSFLAEKCKADLSCKSCDGLNLLHVVLEKKDKAVIGEEAMKSKQEECFKYLLNKCRADFLASSLSKQSTSP